MIDIEVFERLNGLNCAEYLARGIAKHYGRDFQLMYIGAWGGDIDFKKEVSDAGFIIEHSADPLYYFEKYHGIRVCKYKCEKYEEFTRLVREELLHGKPIMVTVDLYWVPWATQDYLMHNWNHEILIIGETAEGWRCYDFFGEKESVLPFENMEKCFSFLHTFDILQTTKVDYELCIEELKKCIKENIVDTAWFAKLDKFSEMFINTTIDYQNLVGSQTDLDTLQQSPFVETINRISQTRSQYAHMLRFLSTRAENVEDIKKISYMFDQAAAAWKSVWGMIQKAYLVEEKSLIVKRIGKRLREISDYERKTHDNLLCCLNDDGHATCEHAIPKARKTEINENSICLPIEKVVNHKAIVKLGSSAKATFQDGFIIADDVIKSGRIKAAGVDFKLCSLDNMCDNIECREQSLPVNTSLVAISILCCSEFAHQIEEIRLITDSGEAVIAFSVTASTWDKAEFGQKLVWKGHQGIVKSEGTLVHSQNLHLYYKKYDLKCETFVKSIELPFSPNIHIFAITLHL